MVKTQLCKACQQQVPESSFPPSQRGLSGKSCNPCQAARTRERYKNDPEFRAKNNARLLAWKEANPERFRKAQRKHYEANKADMDEKSAVWRRENADKHRAAIAAWHKKNPVRSYAHTRMRNLRLKGQTPPDADFEAIYALYEESARLTRETGVRHHVDHIIPLCKGGLHHQDNLRVIPAAENLSKGGRLVETPVCKKAA
jgi:hypothetical protein